MRIKIRLKKLLSIGIAVLFSAMLVGCFDLGDFSDESVYYSTFGDIGLVYQNPEATEKDIERDNYDIEDYFYNKNTVDDFVYGNPEDEESDEGKDIPQLSYVYMVIPVEENLTVESVALYFNADKTCSLEVVFYVVDSLPNDGDFTNIQLLGEPEYQQKLDENGKPMTDENNQPIYERVNYADPAEESIVGRAMVNVKNGEWIPIIMENWNSGDRIMIKESQYLLLRFVNNSGIQTEGNTSVAFRPTNLLIRVFF